MVFDCARTAFALTFLHAFDSHLTVAYVPLRGLLSNIWTFIFGEQEDLSTVITRVIHDTQQQKIRLKEQVSDLTLQASLSLRIPTPKGKGKTKRAEVTLGCAVAVSENLAITALHGKFKKGTKVVLTTRKGKQIDGILDLIIFENDLVDIAVIKLQAGAVFSSYIPFAKSPVSLGQEILVTGLAPDMHGNALPSMHHAHVICIEELDGSALFQSTYVAFDGLSGAGVISKHDVTTGAVSVVGVHVAKHDRSVRTHDVVSVTRDEVNAAICSIDSSIHGHSAYCLICEPSRVPELVAYFDASQA